jgi:prepilin-type N-terminal cleavage/methylation domain-containing protein
MPPQPKKDKHMKRTCQKGFTLIELLIVVAIIGICAVMFLNIGGFTGVTLPAASNGASDYCNFIRPFSCFVETARTCFLGLTFSPQALDSVRPTVLSFNISKPLI